MKSERYKELLIKIDNYIHDGDVGEPVSPTTGSGDGFASPESFILTKGMDLESLSKEKLLLAHALLHKFYGRKEELKELTHKDIEQLHTQIKKKISHKNFDRLDRT